MESIRTKWHTTLRLSSNNWRMKWQPGEKYIQHQEMAFVFYLAGKIVALLQLVGGGMNQILGSSLI